MFVIDCSSVFTMCNSAVALALALQISSFIIFDHSIFHEKVFFDCGFLLRGKCKESDHWMIHSLVEYLKRWKMTTKHGTCDACRVQSPYHQGNYLERHKAYCQSWTDSSDWFLHPTKGFLPAV
jgi:hypothetical protein